MARAWEAWNKVAKRGRELFAQGNWVIMFPEVTRIDRGRKGVYKSGASRLAIDAGVPVVPIAVTAARCWPRKSFLLRPGVGVEPVLEQGPGLKAVAEILAHTHAEPRRRGATHVPAVAGRTGLAIATGQRARAVVLLRDADIEPAVDRDA